MKSYITVGLGYGDEGKGTMVDYLVRNHKAGVVIRYNGGAQAAHNVVLPDGRHHTFSQFGSGTFVPDVKTFLSRHMLVNPLAMMIEERALWNVGVTDAPQRTLIDGRALVTTPYHRALNRLREISRGESRHGSCGMGIGETVQDSLERSESALRCSDMLMPDQLRSKLIDTREAMMFKVTTLGLTPQHHKNPVVAKELSTFDVDITALMNRYSVFTERFLIAHSSQAQEFVSQNDVAVFEGAQGVLLDQQYGFQPYTTWSDTTTQNAHSIIEEFNLCDDIEEIGIIRTFMTRHGHGPLPTEAGELVSVLNGEHNRSNEWQNNFRVGWLDLASIKYALQVNNGVDSLAITHLDKLSLRRTWKMCLGYGFKLEPTSSWEGQLELTDKLLKHDPLYVQISSADNGEDLLQTIEQYSKIPVSMLSAGPTHLDKKLRNSHDSSI